MIRQLKSLTYRSAIWALRTFNPGDVSIRHHYTRDKFSLDAFKHKGYWFHGKRREAPTMQWFGELIRPGHTVLEAGGNIGYVTAYFASLCGPSGKVLVFEPDPANLTYLRRNVGNLPQVAIVEKAVGASSGPRDLFVEKLTGQNNSFYSDYEVFNGNRKVSGLQEQYNRIQTQVVTLDEIGRQLDNHVDFVKMDIEGAELEALQGMQQLAAQAHPIIMVEISREIPKVFNWLLAQDYLLFNEHRQQLHSPSENLSNVFCFHPQKHSDILVRLNAVSA